MSLGTCTVVGTVTVARSSRKRSVIIRFSDCILVSAAIEAASSASCLGSELRATVPLIGFDSTVQAASMISYFSGDDDSHSGLLSKELHSRLTAYGVGYLYLNYF